MTRRIAAILRFLLNRPKVETDIEAEVRFHVECETEKNVRQGMSAAEARRTALVDLGGVESTREQCREARAGRLVESAWQDIRYGVRVLVKNPGFSVAAIVTLALGIGANTAIFSVVYGVLLRPMPFHEGEQLVVLHQQASRAGLTNIPFSVQEITDYRTQSRTLGDVVEHHSMTFLLLGDNTAERVQTAVVSANFFDVLGVRPLYGRAFVPSDESHSADAVLVLSHKYWRERHSADPNIIGRVFRMNNRPHTVIGVLPAIPQYPIESDVYMPTSHCPTRSSEQFIRNRQARMMTVFGRLKMGTPLQQAQADLSTLARQLEQAHPDAYPKGYGYKVAIETLHNDLTRRAQTTFVLLLGAAGLVLLIACANVGNLLLARLLKVQRELAVRSALGASKMRLVRQLMTESLLLATVGGAVGIALAPIAMSLLVRFAERFTTRAAEVKMDAPVLLFAAAVSLAAGVLFGLAPAMITSRQFSEALRAAAGRTTIGQNGQRLRGGLAVAQIAVSCVLLTCAGLMMRSFQRLQQVDPGFSTDRLLTMRLTPDNTRYSNTVAMRGLWDRVLRRVRGVGGVETAALASNFPFNPTGIVSGPGAVDFEIEGRPVSRGDLQPLVDLTVVSADYFATIRQPLVSGRYFSEHDDADALPVAVINQTMARHHWPGESPVGKRVSLNNGRRWITIAGIVGDVKEYGLDRPVSDELYLPLLQNGFANELVLRTAHDPSSLTPFVLAALREIDRHMAVDKVHTMERLAQDSFMQPRVTALLLALFAGLAVLIAACGVAAVMALSVSQRTREMGIRMALGAPREVVVRMVIRQGVGLGIAGTLAGLLGSLAVSRLLSPLLYDTSSTDFTTYAVVLSLFLFVSVGACLVPARLVTAIDPLAALRQE